MPIPMPPPPPPYVAPDLRPIVATEGATLVFHRQRTTRRVVARSLDHGVWIAAEGAPLELRFHRRADGTVWGEQATYVDGDRMRGFARISASAHEQVLSKRLVGGMGHAANVVRYSVLDSAGRRLRTWSASMCGTDGVVRLDRDGAPEDPTFPSSWHGCGHDGSYVLGRLVALDRGWATRAPRSVARSVRPLAAGRYTLRIELDPLQGIAQSDRSNDAVTVPLTVRTVLGSGGFGIEVVDPISFPTGSATSRRRHHAPEPQWYALQLRQLEQRVEARRLQRTQGPAARASSTTPPPANVDLPDLRTAPSYGISAGSVRKAGTRRDLLRFGALTWNAGPGPLEVEAFRETGTTLSAYQVFTRDGERAARQERGTLVWHAAPGHDHFHFSAFAHYQLTRMDGTVVRDGGKHSWCIVDTDVVDTTVPGAGLGQRSPWSGGGDCGSDPGSLWARLSLSVGAGDYYGAGIAGQAFDVTGLANGLYRIRIEANPTGVLAEADYANNVSSRVVRLGGRPGRRIVVPREVATIDEDSWDECFDFDFDC